MQALVGKNVCKTRRIGSGVEGALESFVCISTAVFCSKFSLIGQFIGGSRWRWRCAPPPPPRKGSNSFVFACVFAEKHTHWRSSSPMGRHPPTEILDPPLQLPNSKQKCIGTRPLPALGKKSKHLQSY